MASETVDPIDWSYPPPYTEQYPLSSTYCTLQCGLQITRLAALSQQRTCDFRMPDQRTAGAATQGINMNMQYTPYKLNNVWIFILSIYCNMKIMKYGISIVIMRIISIKGKSHLPESNRARLMPVSVRVRFMCSKLLSSFEGVARY